MISQGFKVTAYDGYAAYQVIGIAIADNRLMQITYKKKDLLVCDIVEWKHALMVEPY